MMRMVSSMLATGLVLGGLAGTPACAQSVADFYRGKTVNVLIGVGVGGEYDLQARLVARHLGKHIPGNPNYPISRWRRSTASRCRRSSAR